MDKNLTDNEIKKALEYWKKFGEETDQMLGGRYKGDKDLLEQKEIVKITFEVFDLIKYLQAENERLKAGADSLFDTLDYRLKRILKLEDNLKTAKAEAYKEFAEKYGKLIWELKNEYLKKGNLAYASALVFSHTKLQNFLIELVGEDNESKN